MLKDSRVATGTRRSFARNMGSLAVAVSMLAAAGLAAPGDEVQELGVTGRNNEAPWIAADGQFVAVTWAAQETGDNPDIYVAVSRDGGGRFGPAVRVNKQPGEAYVSGEFPPRVALARSASGGDPEVVVAWTARTTDAEIRLARSRDGGRTFGAAESLQAPGAPGERGWQALAIDEQGRAHVIWLDHRGLAEDWEEPVREKPLTEREEAMAMVERSSLYYNVQGAGGAREKMLTKSVCYCCKTALAAGPGGSIHAAWRHVYPGSIRDIAFISSRDGGRTFGTPVRVSNDRWELDGCPDDGPAMAVGPDGRIHVVWPTVIDGAEPEGAIFYATSTDGQTFSPRLRVPTLGSPKPSHPQIARDPLGRVTVAWDEMQGSSRKVAARVMSVGPAGRATFGPAIILNSGAAGMYPVLASDSRGTLAVWTQGTAPDSRIAVRRVESPPRPSAGR